MEVCPISSQQPTREGGREGGMDIQRKREKTSYSLRLHLTFVFLPNRTLHFPCRLEFQRHSYCRIIPKRILGFLQMILKPWRCSKDIIQVRIPEAWYLVEMARGIESLVSLNPFYSVDSAQGEHSDNCKFWLLDLGRCHDPVCVAWVMAWCGGRKSISSSSAVKCCIWSLCVCLGKKNDELQ